MLPFFYCIIVDVTSFALKLERELCFSIHILYICYLVVVSGHYNLRFCCFDFH